MAVAYAVLLAALTVATWGPGTPVWALVALTLSAGACAPPLGPVMRALWSDLMPDREMRQRAFSLDTVAEELLYVVGPLVAGLFIAFGNPALGVGVSALLALAGSLALAYAPITRRDRSDREAAGPAEPGPGAPVGATGPFAPAVVAGGVGVSLGALDLLVVAFAERHHHIAAVAWIQAALSVGSAVGGLAYGARAWRLTSLQRLPLLAVALSVSLGAAGLAPGIFPLAVAVGCGRPLRRPHAVHRLHGRGRVRHAGDPGPGGHMGQQRLQRGQFRRYDSRGPGPGPLSALAVLRRGGPPHTGLVPPGHHHAPPLRPDQPRRRPVKAPTTAPGPSLTARFRAAEAGRFGARVRVLACVSEVVAARARVRDESGERVGREEQRRALGVLGVADRDGAVRGTGQVRRLNAVVARAAVGGPEPVGDTGERRSRNSTEVSRHSVISRAR